jgi:hypothetical protein
VFERLHFQYHVTFLFLKVTMPWTHWLSKGHSVMSSWRQRQASVREDMMMVCEAWETEGNWWGRRRVIGTSSSGLLYFIPAVLSSWIVNTTLNTQCSYEVPGLILLCYLKGAIRLDRNKNMSVHVSTCTSYSFNALTPIVGKLWLW